MFQFCSNWAWFSGGVTSSTSKNCRTNRTGPMYKNIKTFRTSRIGKFCRNNINRSFLSLFL